MTVINGHAGEVAAAVVAAAEIQGLDHLRKAVRTHVSNPRTDGDHAMLSRGGNATEGAHAVSSMSWITKVNQPSLKDLRTCERGLHRLVPNQMMEVARKRVELPGLRVRIGVNGVGRRKDQWTLPSIGAG